MDKKDSKKAKLCPFRKTKIYLNRQNITTGKHNPDCFKEVERFTECLEENCAIFKDGQCGNIK